MKIALISPRGSFLSNNTEFRKFWLKNNGIETYRKFWSGFGAGLLLVAALLPKKSEIVLIDENIETINFRDNFDLVIISAITQQALRAYQIAEIFRQRDIKVVMGGIHATILPEEAKKYVDIVAVGEAEGIIPQLIVDFFNGKTSPMYKSFIPVDLTSSPIPKYDLLKTKNYKIIWLQTSRGCPFNCEFCAASKIFGLKFRHKSIEQVLNEVKIIKEKFGNIMIGFGDDNMFIDKNFSKLLLEKLVPFKLRWITQTDISVAKDEELLKLLKKSGCRFLFIGLESLSKGNLSLIDKYRKKAKELEKYSEYIKKIQSNGIGVMGAFILGFDGDDNSSFDKISNFIVENRLYGAQISILTPLPGTSLRKRLEQEGRLLSTNWDNYTFFDVNYLPKKISSDELEMGLLRIYKRVYDKRFLLKKADYFKNIYANNFRLKDRRK